MTDYWLGTLTGAHTHTVGIGADSNTTSIPDNQTWWDDRMLAAGADHPFPEIYRYSIKYEEKTNKKENYDMKTLYDVYLVYAEDRKSPFIEVRKGIIADSEEDAKIKSGLMKMVEDTWDADYLTFIVVELGGVKVKPKPNEVKNI